MRIIAIALPLLRVRGNLAIVFIVQLLLLLMMVVAL